MLAVEKRAQEVEEEIMETQVILRTMEQVLRVLMAHRDTAEKDGDAAQARRLDTRIACTTEFVASKARELKALEADLAKARAKEGEPGSAAQR